MAAIACQWHARYWIDSKSVMWTGLNACTAGDTRRFVQCQPSVLRLSQCLCWTGSDAGGINAELACDGAIDSCGIILENE